MLTDRVTTMYANELVKTLSLNEGTSKRLDCPECGGSNTLSVSMELGSLKWLCFKAGCGVKGVEKAHRSSEAIRDALTAHRNTSPKPFDVPDYFTSILSDEEAMRYVEAMHSMTAYTYGLVDIRFDPKRRRVVYMIYAQGQIVDAVGRALDKHVKPKWLRYANSGHPLIVGNHDTAAIVEDAPSACAVSASVTGVSLLGTSVQQSHLSELKRFKKVLICLDKDATKKSLEIHKKLSYFVDAAVRPLEDDLKYLSPEEVRAVLRL
jgi:hypothetical protein